VLLATTLNVHSRLFGSARRTVPLEGKSVCLTIDDGPCGDTVEILDLLDAYGAKAVFFLIGEQAAARPDDVREILRRGHWIGNHTQTHPAGKFWIYGPWSQRREIRNCQETLTALTGGPPTGLFRAPAGFRNPFTAPVLREAGLKAWGWHARGFDTSCNDIPLILRRLTTGLKPGAILLIHQGQPHHCEVLRQLLEQLSGNGWSCRLPQKELLNNPFLQPQKRLR
jgi:peptidoglycan/xylan/chitin deacetylase (PgdA/CDA1 family)